MLNSIMHVYCYNPLSRSLTSEKMQDTAHTRAYFDSARF